MNLCAVEHVSRSHKNNLPTLNLCAIFFLKKVMKSQISVAEVLEEHHD